MTIALSHSNASHVLQVHHRACYSARRAGDSGPAGVVGNLMFGALAGAGQLSISASVDLASQLENGRTTSST